jgi:hypothetical protein
MLFAPCSTGGQVVAGSNPASPPQYGPLRYADRHVAARNPHLECLYGKVLEINLYQLLHHS